MSISKKAEAIAQNGGTSRIGFCGVGEYVEKSLGEIEIAKSCERKAIYDRQVMEDKLVTYLSDAGYHEMLELNYTEIRRQFT